MDSKLEEREAPAGGAAIDRVYAEQGISLLVLGKGKVGSELLEQIRAQRTELERDYDTVLRVVGVGDRRGTAFDEDGLDLARRILRDASLTVFDKVGDSGRPWGEELLEPTAIYVRPVLRALRRAKVHGMAHITGGGLRNLIRLKPKLEFRITEPLDPSPMFRELQSLGGIEDREMYQTFNMGMGFAVIAPEPEAKAIVRALRPEVNARIVGEVVRGAGVSVPSLGLAWTKY